MFGVLASSPRCPGGHTSASDRGHSSKNVIQQHTGIEESSKTGLEKDRENFKKAGLFNFITFKRNEEHIRHREARRASEPHGNERLTLEPNTPSPPVDDTRSRSPKHHGFFHGLFTSHSSEDKKSTDRKERKKRFKRHEHAETVPIP